jgi:hypothetical protein
MHPHEVVYMKYMATAAACFSTFLPNAFVSRMNRRIDIRIVRFWRSGYDVAKVGYRNNLETKRIEVDPERGPLVAKLFE